MRLRFSVHMESFGFLLKMSVAMFISPQCCVCATINDTRRHQTLAG